VFEIIPRVAQDIFEGEGLQIFSVQIYSTNRGPSLKIGAEYNWRRKKIDPLTPPASKRLREKVKARLREKGYRMKIQALQVEKKTYQNEFRIKILLKETDLTDDIFAAAIQASQTKLRAKEEGKTVRERFQ